VFGTRSVAPVHRAALISVLTALLTLGACNGDGDRAPIRSYVSMGDSFTSGAGLPQTTTPCQRSRLAYPTLVAKELDARLVDASCGGATTANVTAPQQIVSTSLPPQLDAVTRSTDLVTVQLGYNDQNWYGALFLGCAEMTPTDPGGHPCQDAAPVGGSNPEATARAIGDQVVATLEKVEKKAPDALVLLVGYPQLVPASGTCPDLPLAAGDYPYVRSMMELFDDELRRAADQAGVTYVDVLGPSAGHDICAGDQAWVNGGVTIPGVAAGYHPFERGQRAVADLVLATLGQ
jgi:lysophospholipase L1-like esterase